MSILALVPRTERRLVQKTIHKTCVNNHARRLTAMRVLLRVGRITDVARTLNVPVRPWDAGSAGLPVWRAGTPVSQQVVSLSAGKTCVFSQNLLMLLFPNSGRLAEGGVNKNPIRPDIYPRCQSDDTEDVDAFPDWQFCRDACYYRVLVLRTVALASCVAITARTPCPASFISLKYNSMLRRQSLLCAISSALIPASTFFSRVSCPARGHRCHLTGPHPA